MVQIREIDDNLPFDLEDILNKDVNNTSLLQLGQNTTPIESNSLDTCQMHPTLSSTKQPTVEVEFIGSS